MSTDKDNIVKKDFASLEELNEFLKEKDFKVEKVHRNDFEKVYVLLQILDPKMSKKQWLHLFDYKWKGARDYFGFGIYHKKELIGFIGTIFSERKIGGKTQTICNLTSLIIKEEYRSKGLSKFLLYAVLMSKDYTVTGFSASERAYKLYQGLGFKDFETAFVKIPTYKNLLIKQKVFTGIKKIDYTKIKYLNDREKEIYNDHKNYKCYHMIIGDKDNFSQNYCYVIFNIIFRNRQVLAYLNYISNPEVFNKNIEKFCRYLFFRHMALFIIVDKRLLNVNKSIAYLEVPLMIPKIYKSASLEPSDIDNLYSELLLLNI